MTSLEDEVTFEVKGKIAIIKLNQPKKLNALGQPQYFRLASLLREIAEKDEIVFTVLTGTGRFFSAGADVRTNRDAPSADENVPVRLFHIRRAMGNNIELTNAVYTHPKILITALNGPVIGLSAALIAHSDFIYAAPHTYLLTPFSSLGLVAEGNSSKAFVERLGISKANEALIMSKRITCEELVHTGFVNKVFDIQPGESDKFLQLVLDEINDRLGDHLNSSSILKIKEQIRSVDRAAHDKQLVAEFMGGLERFSSGIPQEEFRKIAMGEKRHKL